MTLREQIAQIQTVCKKEELLRVERMIMQAARYVQEVVVMETTAWNLPGREGEELRDAKSGTDSSRRSAHDSLIVSVKSVNRLCKEHALPLIYTGDLEARREYGDFALALVREFFEDRH